MSFLPCPKCGDDETFLDRPAGAKRCSTCHQLCAVVRTPEGNRVLTTRRRRRGRSTAAVLDLPDQLLRR